jgi:hypothetical protein
VIRVREKQLGEIEQALALELFEDEMPAHVRAFAPRHAAVIGDTGVRRAVALGIERARTHGVTNPGLLRFYVELMFMLGGMFDTDPAQPWAGEILRDAGHPDPAARIDRLYDATILYLDAVEGPDGVYSVAAMRRLLDLVRDSAATADLRFEEKALGTMQRVYPERCAHVGDAPLRELARRAVAEAARLGVATEVGTGLVVGLMFGMGHGFADDPLFPWVQATLRDPAIKTAERRVARLQRRVTIYVDRALEHLERRRADGQG